MSLFNRLKQHLKGYKKPPDADPATAYNLWSQSYDEQPGNLMLDLDNELFSALLTNVSLKNKTAIDIGCGTGRHWDEILALEPLKLSGYDVSPGMLEKLSGKYPSADVYELHGNYMPGLENESCDVVISTLTLAHIEHVEDALREWRRVLKYGGEMIITDYHPEALKNGADRTFKYGGKTIAIKNHVHETDMLFERLHGMGFELLRFEEKKIDSTVRHYYEERNALPVFEKFNNVPIIYGMHLKKKDVIT